MRRHSILVPCSSRAPFDVQASGAIHSRDTGDALRWWITFLAEANGTIGIIHKPVNSAQPLADFTGCQKSRHLLAGPCEAPPIEGCTRNAPTSRKDLDALHSASVSRMVSEHTIEFPECRVQARAGGKAFQENNLRNVCPDTLVLSIMRRPCCHLLMM